MNSCLRWFSRILTMPVTPAFVSLEKSTREVSSENRGGF